MQKRSWNNGIGHYRVYTRASRIKFPSLERWKKKEEKGKKERSVRDDKPDNPFQDGRASLLALVRRPEFVGQLGEKWDQTSPFPPNFASKYFLRNFIYLRIFSPFLNNIRNIQTTRRISRHFLIVRGKVN